MTTEPIKKKRRVSQRGCRQKGVAGERELAALLDGATIRGRTLTARRVPNVGAMAGGGWGGDVLMGERCAHCLAGSGPGPGVTLGGLCTVCDGRGLVNEERVEVKRRAGGRGFALLERWIADSYALALRTDRIVWPDGTVKQRGEWLIVMRLKDFAEKAE